MFNPVYKVESNPRAMDMLLSVLCMVICARVPKNIVQFKPENLMSKVRLVNPPRGCELQDRMVVDDKG